MPDRTTGDPLTAYVRVLRRRWRLVGLCTVTGLLLAAAALYAVPNTYTATTVVQVNPTGLADVTGEDAGRTNGEVNLDTEAQVVSSATVAAGALRLLDESPGEADLTDAQENVEVTVPPNSSVLEISYAGPDPGTARDTSLAFAEAYLEHREDWIGDRVAERLAGLDEELESRYAQLAEDEPADADTDTPADAPAPPTREETLHAEIDTLHEQRTPLSAVNEALSAGQILTQATVPTEASAPRTELWLVAGTLLGLVAGLAASYTRERLQGAPPADDAPAESATGSPVDDTPVPAPTRPAERAPAHAGSGAGAEVATDFATSR